MFLNAIKIGQKVKNWAKKVKNWAKKKEFAQKQKNWPKKGKNDPDPVTLKSRMFPLTFSSLFLPIIMI